ncbi:MAG: hypothetical protein GY814_12170 [Gammaproteobacteria bacterium]|nr:hypothetical protein [Gammaproteobacteria bacterium]
MSSLPSDAKKIEVAGATVEFFEYEESGLTIYQFDTSMTGPPEPMVNAMAGLKMVDSPDKALVMINHKSPGGLFNKIGENYTYESQDIDDGKIKIIFKYVAGESEKTDFSNNSCG